MVNFHDDGVTNFVRIVLDGNLAWSCRTHDRGFLCGLIASPQNEILILAIFLQCLGLFCGLGLIDYDIGEKRDGRGGSTIPSVDFLDSLRRHWYLALF